MKIPRGFAATFGTTLLTILASGAALAQSVALKNRDLSLSFDLSHGVAITNIRDEVTNHVYLNGAQSLFELAPDEVAATCPGAGAPLQSSDGLTVDQSVSTANRLFVTGRISRLQTLHFFLVVDLPPGSSVATLRLTFTNSGATAVCIRSVFPKLFGLIPPGDGRHAMAAVPTEIGGVAPLSAQTLGMSLNKDIGLPGMPLNKDIGLPPSFNPVEVATMYDQNGGGGLFFADIDGNLDAGIPPLQFTLSAKEVDAYSVGRVAPQASLTLSRLAIGVYHVGDWHMPVTYWLNRHPAQVPHVDIPGWLRDEGALYSFAAGGAGGMYLGVGLPARPLANGQITTNFEVDNGVWGTKPPATLTDANIAPQGAQIAALARNDQQEDVFYVAQDGSVQTLFEVNSGPWNDPIALTRAGYVRPGGYTAAVKRNDLQEDLFFLGTDNQVWTVFEVGNAAWSPPIRLSTVRAGLAPSGGGIAAARRNDHQEDVFVAGAEGAIWTLFELNNGPWSPTLPITGGNFALAGQPLTAVVRNQRQEDVFLCAADGAVWTLFELDDGAFSEPIALTAPDFCNPGSPVAALMRNANQEDVFVVDKSGAVWTLFEVNDSPFSAPIRLTGAGFTVSGASLSAVARNSRQEDLFVVDKFGTTQTLFVVDNGAWNGPTIVGPAFLRPGAPVASVVRNIHQEDIFTLSAGSINSFRDLPQLLDEAQALGTNIVYLWDYWQGTKAGGFPPYWNKGDYIARSDLGGEQALMDGINAVHQRGGRVILYVEPFIVYPYSDLGAQLGPQWEAWDALGPMFEREPYTGYFKMVAPFTPWQDHLLDVGRRLVGNYGADGIFLDSGGWQLNWPVKAGSSGYFYSSAEYTRGFFQLVDRLRGTIRSLPGHSDAVVLGETTSGPVAGHWDGGFSADFSFNRDSSGGTITASPVRFALPQVNVMSNGLNLNELQQVYAAGHGLALCCMFPGNFMYDNAQYVRRLVGLRQAHADALVHGAQTYQPTTGQPAVAAYFYKGVTENLITVVNTDGNAPYAGALGLRVVDAGSMWTDLLTGEVFHSARYLNPPFIRLPLSIPAAGSGQGLRILLRQ